MGQDMSTPPFDEKTNEALGLAIMAALGVTRPVRGLTLHWHVDHLPTLTVEEYMPPTVDGVEEVKGQISSYVLTPSAASR
jgi:hypothetical protein